VDVEFRALRRDEIALIWTIDRREVIHNIYVLRGGELVLRPEFFDMQGWPPGEAELYTPLLERCFERGGRFVGAFDGERLAGAVVVDTPRLGPAGDLVQLKMLHVGRDYRGQGLGAALFERARYLARELGASGLYVSATPSENTIRFYLRHGCAVTPSPDPELFALEPEDIHLECRW
jgi:predicted N-acetyltransferase YhbS